jgi:LysR family transcriptional regulator for bpeEF and oprC
MHTDKNAMALYVRVVEAGSFSKAAARERVPVSTVSRRIADLEKALGVRLLERSTRQLRMTEIGQGYFESCRRGLAEFEAADSLVTQRQAEISGRLRISVPPSMSDVAIVPLISAFEERYPKVTVHCLVTERYIDYIADGIDFSLRVGHPGNRDSNVVASTVAIHRPRLVASPGYLGRIKPIARPQQLAAHVQVAFSRWERPVAWTLSNGHKSLRVAPEPRLVLNDYVGVLQGLVGGLGISELPGFLCKVALQQGRLVEVLPDWQFASVKLAAAFPSNRNLSPLVRAFKDFCAKYFEANPLA